MKNIFLLLSACLLISLAGFSQKEKVPPEEVPGPVNQAFANKFPGATDLHYQMENKDYEINFKFNGIETSANFDATGKWLETETGLKQSDLPKEVIASVSKNFAGFKLSEIGKIETLTKGICYELDLKKDKEGYEVQFNAKGDILSKLPLRKED
jgi:hypothetical protein